MNVYIYTHNKTHLLLYDPLDIACCLLIVMLPAEDLHWMTTSKTHARPIL